MKEDAAGTAILTIEKATMSSENAFGVDSIVLHHLNLALRRANEAFEDIWLEKAKREALERMEALREERP